MSEEPEKKGWFARFRRGTPASELPQSAEPPQSAESEVEKEAEAAVSPPPSESVSEAPDSPTRADLEREEEVEKKGWLSRWRSKGDSAPETPEPEAASDLDRTRCSSLACTSRG